MKTRAWDGERFRDDYVVMPDGSIHRSFKVDNGVEFMEFYEIAEQVNWKLSRFTGRLDKNGNEIYEGDITKVETDLIYANGQRVGKKCTCLHVIEWFEDQWCHRSIKNIENYPGVIGFLTRGIEVHSKYAEVIGDVFQNPELLEVK